MNDGKSRRERGPDPFVSGRSRKAGASGKFYDSSMLVENEEGHECWTAGCRPADDVGGSHWRSR